VTTDPSPLAGLDFALVGPGRVGSSLALWAVARGARCLSVSGRPGSQTADALAERLGARTARPTEPADAEARLVWIAVPDRSIQEVARRLSSGSRNSVVMHVSGALGASALVPLAAEGCRVGAFHPLRAFPQVEPDPTAAAGTFFALDGDPEARSLGRRLAEAFGGVAGVVPEEQRTLYHWAATLAAGGVTTLLATAQAVGGRIGLPESALRGYGRLAAGALEAAASEPDPSAAITGPAVRGDWETIERQLAAVRGQTPDLLPLALEIVRATVARLAESGPLDPAQKALSERLERADLLDRSKDRVLTSQRPEPV
jgi:predicted short-subunit dehydrogenase-like oxidoreductase (DUF2520 family)